MKPRYEVRHTCAGFHIVFRAGNAEDVEFGQVLKTRRSAIKAIESITGCPVSWVEGECWAHRCGDDVRVTFPIPIPRRTPRPTLPDLTKGAPS